MDRKSLFARPSGIKPPTDFRSTMKKSLKKVYRPSEMREAQYSSNSTRNPLTALNFNLLSTMKNTSYSVGKSRTSSIGRPTFGSGKKSMTSSTLFGMTPQTKRTSIQMGSARASVGSARRASSIGARGTTIKDDRNLTDSSNQLQCVQKLLIFLKDIGYNKKLNANLHKAISSKDIREIFGFIYCTYFDKSFNSAAMNIQNDIPFLMQNMGYPYSIKKSDLTSCAGARSLGSVLGIFDWLVDACRNFESTNPEHMGGLNFDNEVLDIKNELIQIALSNAMNPTNDFGETAEISDKVNEQLNQLAGRVFGTENEFREKEEEVEQLEEEVQKLNDKIAEYDELPARLDGFCQDISNLKDYISKLEEYIQQRESEFEELCEEGIEEENKLKEIIEKKHSLQNQVKEQQFTMEDVKQTYDRIHQLEERRKNEESEIENLRSEIRNAKKNFNQRKDQFYVLLNASISYIKYMNELADLIGNHEEAQDLKSKIADPFWHEISEQMKDKVDEITLEDLQCFEQKLNAIKMIAVKLLASLRCSIKTSKSIKLNQLKTNYEKLEIKAKELEESYQTKANDLEHEKKENVETLDFKRQELRKYEKQSVQEFENVNEDLEKIIQELKSKIKVNEACYLEEINSIKNEMNTYTAAVKNDLVVLLKALKEYNKKCEATNRKMEKIQKSVENMRNTNLKIKNEVKKEQDEVE